MLHVVMLTETTVSGFSVAVKEVYYSSILYLCIHFENKYMNE